MSKQRILIIAVVILVIINLATLSFLWFSKSNNKHARIKKRHPQVERFLARKLNLSEDQIQAFKTAREKHFDDTRKISRSLHADRKHLTQLLSVEDTNEQKTLLAEISVKRNKLEQLNFQHLKNLRAICTDEQKKKFDSVIFKVIDRGAGFDRDRRPRHKKKK